ncbi:MAG: NAD-dependent deacylase [Rhodocyclales bacterium]|nr:NAD-dependent deacylase [Rhodocyclales bacterium]
MDISEDLIGRLRNAKHVLVFTGAGVSAESGIPTFRDALTGLWERFDAEELATPKAFLNDPALVWGWYEWRRMKVLRARPNPAHLAIAALETRVPRLTVVTQNVDDLHERAGSRDVLHLHGRLDSPFCFACRRPAVYPNEIPEEPEGGRHVEPPRCSCGGLIRPGVVWFGEMLPEIEWNAAIDAARSCDAFLCIGTSSVVQPAASLTMMAIQRGAITIQVNPNPTALDDQVTINLSGQAGKILPELVETAWGDS